MNIYCVSGLGADETVFQFLELGKYKLIHVPWSVPEDNQSIKSYAETLRVDFEISEPCVIIGLSFGGMIGVELAKLINSDKVILIASIPRVSELPRRYRMAKAIRIHRWIPISILKSANWFSYYFFGVKSKEHKKILKTILNNTDKIFLRWALNAMLNWKESESVDLVRIHGTNDRILPIRTKNEKCDYLVEGGGHLMVLDKAKEISEYLIKELSSTEQSIK